jgi:transcriptional regulator with XRE-family HTH domain
MTMQADFAAHLRHLMEEREVPRAKLARRSGLTREAVRKLEMDGSDPKLSTLVKLAGAFDVDVCRMLPDAAPDHAGLTPESVARLRDKILLLLGKVEESLDKCWETRPPGRDGTEANKAICNLRAAVESTLAPPPTTAKGSTPALAHAAVPILVWPAG